MAIIKEIESEYGVPFKYHKIQSVRVESQDNEIILIMKVASYVSKEARAANKNAVYTECCINNADFALTPFYSLLKTKFPQFEGDDDFDNTFKGGDTRNPYVTYVQQGNAGYDKRIEGPDQTEDLEEVLEEDNQEDKE